MVQIGLSLGTVPNAVITGVGTVPEPNQLWEDVLYPVGSFTALPYLGESCFISVVLSLDKSFKFHFVIHLCNCTIRLLRRLFPIRYDGTTRHIVSNLCQRPCHQ